MQWKVRAWRRSWDRLVGRVRNRAQAVTYAHQTCPRCSHPAGADEKVCTRCTEPLGGRTVQRVGRAMGSLWESNTPVVATMLTCAIGALYVVSILWSSRVGIGGFSLSPHSLALDRFGAMSTWEIEAGQWWRLSMATFLHINVLHLAFNLMSLWSVTIYLEDVLGKSKTFALYLALGLVASLVSYLWHAYTPPYVGASAGASGAVCGLIGVCLGFSLRKRNVARHLRSHYISWAVWIAIIGLSAWQIDNAGHVGGFVPGLLIGLLVRRKADTGGFARRFWTASAAILVAVTLASLVLASRHRLPDDVMEQATSDTFRDDD